VNFVEALLLQVWQQEANIGKLVLSLNVMDFEALFGQKRMVKLHRSPVEFQFLLMKVVLAKKEKLFDQINFAPRQKGGVMLKQLVRENYCGTSHFLFRRHLSLQYFTSPQTFSHFLRHTKLRRHTGQVVVGRFCFFIFKQSFAFVSPEILSGRGR
jgi:hypothetical protein